MPRTESSGTTSSPLVPHKTEENTLNITRGSSPYRGGPVSKEWKPWNELQFSISQEQDYTNSEPLAPGRHHLLPSPHMRCVHQASQMKQPAHTISQLFAHGTHHQQHHQPSHMPATGTEQRTPMHTWITSLQSSRCQSDCPQQTPSHKTVQQ